MTQDDVLFGYRLQLFDLAARTSVSQACRTFGVHRSTYYALEAQVERQGLEMLRPRERRRPQMPNQLPRMVEQRIVAFALGHPGSGRGASRRARAGPSGAGSSSPPTASGKALRRHGLNTRAKRLALIAGYRAPYEPPREPAPEPHIDVDRPGELVGIDCFYVGRLRGTKGAIWQLTAIDVYSSYAWAELVVCTQRQPDRRADLHARAPRRARAARRRLAARARALRQRQRVPRPARSPPTLDRLGARHTRIRAGRPQTNGHVEAAAPDDPRRVLAARVRPLPPPALHRPAPRTRRLPATTTTSTASTTAASPKADPRRHRLRCPQDGAEMSRNCRHISESVQPRAATSCARGPRIQRISSVSQAA